MKQAIAMLGLIWLGGGASYCTAGASATGSSLPEVGGILGLSPVGPSTYVAVFVPVAEAQALAGILWYNNDGLAAFPRVLLASGAAETPVATEECSVVGEGVLGVSSGWSEMNFPAPIGSASEGLYLMFQLPEGSECRGEGAGSGAGIGFSTTGGLAGWLSADGEQWAGLRAGYNLAVRPIFVDRTTGMQVMSKTAAAVERPQVWATQLLPSGPNPFNPRTAIRFSLAEALPVSLVVYDPRGRRVRALVTERLEPGEHAAVWDGRDEHGQPQASGVYLMRFQAGSIVTTHRLTLVR